MSVADAGSGVMKVMKVTKMMKVRTRAAATKAFGFCLTYVTSITFITTSAAFAAEAEKPFASPQVAERVATPGAGSLAQVTLSLVLVLGAVFAAAWLVRRLKTFGKFGSGPIEVVADISLGAKERAVLVQVGGKQLLLGVAPGRVSTLHVLDETVTVDKLKGIAAGGVAGNVANGPENGRERPDFKAILKRSLGL
jgi:flagellar protein FliO/FliZ